jgi:DNA-binding transcriptional LysR family regulator
MLHTGAALMHNQNMFDWDDLRYFLAVAESGSTIAAGKSLGVNQSTVHRRLNELEKRLQRKLVTRETTGYRLTEYGIELLPFAKRCEETILELQRHVKDKTRDLIGNIRVTCPEPLVARIMKSPLLERFSLLHPNLKIEFVSSDRYLDLSKGEADVAFRSGDTDDELIGRKIAESLWAIYASKDYIASNGRPDQTTELTNHPLVAFDETLSAHRALTWLKDVAPQANFISRHNSVLGLVSAIKSGIGIGPLPTALGDAEGELVKLIGPIPELTRSWRMLAHPDLRRAPRVAALFDFIVKESALLKSIFTG